MNLIPHMKKMLNQEKLLNPPCGCVADRIESSIDFDSVGIKRNQAPKGRLLGP